MGRVYRVIAALMLIVFIPVAVLAGPMRLCVSEDGHQAVELAHAPHDMDLDVVDVAAALAAVADNHDDGRPCFDRPLIAAHSSAHASNIDGQFSKLDTGIDAAGLTRVADFSSTPAPNGIAQHPYPASVLDDPQLAALRTIVLLI